MNNVELVKAIINEYDNDVDRLDALWEFTSNGHVCQMDFEILVRMIMTGE